MEKTMVKGHRKKQAARALRKSNPDLTQPEARRLVSGQPRHSLVDLVDPADLERDLGSVLTDTMVGSEDELLGQELTTIPDGSAFHADLDEELGDITIDQVVQFHDWTATHDIHDTFEGGGQVGDCSIEATLEYSASIAKADYYAAPASVTWTVSDPHWSPTHVLVAGYFEAELIYHFQVSDGASVEYFKLQGLSRIDSPNLKQLAATPIVPEVTNWMYDKYRNSPWPIDTGKPWLKARFEARERREQNEIDTHGQIRQVVPDDSLDPEVLIRDLRLLNYGDARAVLATPSRESDLRTFARSLGVEVDQWQTYPPQNREPAEVDAELNAALRRFLAAEEGPDSQG